MVKTMPLDANVIAPLDCSNNTGEMKAIIELFDYMLYYSHLPPGSEVRATHNMSFAPCLAINSPLLIISWLNLPNNTLLHSVLFILCN